MWIYRLRARGLIRRAALLVDRQRTTLAMMAATIPLELLTRMASLPERTYLYPRGGALAIPTSRSPAFLAAKPFLDMFNA